MNKLLIVDDEAPVIQGLLSNIPWEKFGIQVCATALNGRDAYSLALEHNPDIVITDIRMPIVNGLELIEKVKAHSPETIFIVFSGYSDFEYAKKSIELDVVYYLIKPSSIEEIEAALSKAMARRNELEEHRRSQDERGTYRRWDEVQKFRNCMYGIEEVEGLVLEEACVVLVAGMNAVETESDYKEIRSELIQQSWCKDVDVNKHSLVVVLSERYTDEVLRLLDRMSPKAVCVGISEPIWDARSLKNAYEQAIDAMKHAVYINSTVVRTMEFTYYTADFNHWQKTIAAYPRTMEGFKVLISDFEKGIRTSLLDPEGFKQQFIHVSYLIFNWMDNEIGHTASKLMGERFIFQKCMTEPIAIHVCMEWLHELMECLEAYVINHIEPFTDKTIEKLKRYMQENLATDISLIYLAQIAHMSPAYLSSLFKKKNGSSISDYLVSIRIEHAKYLLRETGMKINDVARDSGYNDQRYFSGVFKRYTGLTAGEYRNAYSKI